MKTLLFLMTLILLFSSCQKQPTAAFTTDKNEYTAGETIHLTNTSDNGDSHLWTTPDGKTYTTENLDYNTDINEHSGSKIFKLDVFSKNKKKTATVSKSINVKQAILPTDYYSVKTVSFIPEEKKSFVMDGNWIIEAVPHYDIYKGYCQIFFPENHAPTSNSSYTLVSSSNTLLPGQAFIKIKYPYEAELYYTSVSGQLDVTISNNGKIRAIFNNITTRWSFDNSLHNASGDITCE